MVQEHSQLVHHCAPEQWSQVYDERKQGNRTFVFRRGVEVVLETVANLDCASGLWLDIGCGTGQLAARLSETGRAVIGIDHDARMTDHAKRRFGNAGSTGKLKFLSASAYELPFEGATVDGVVATSLTGCLSFPDRFFREVHRVLRQGGHAIMTFTNRASRLLRLNGRIHRAQFQCGKSTDHSFPCRLYRSERVGEDLRRIGFAAVSVRYYNFFLNVGNMLIPPKPAALYLERLHRYRMSRRLGRNFVVVAHRV